jgi:hypothetical protein
MGNLKTTSVVVALAVMTAALAASSVAFAAPSVSGTAAARGGRVQAEIPSSQAVKAHRDGTAAAATSGGLRLTGLDLTLILGGGFVLVASGVALSGLVLRRVRA